MADSRFTFAPAFRMSRLITETVRAINLYTPNPAERTSVEEILSGSRLAHVVRARTIFCRVASIHGYNRQQIETYMGMVNTGARYHEMKYRRDLENPDFAAIAQPVVAKVGHNWDF